MLDSCAECKGLEEIEIKTNMPPIWKKFSVCGESIQQKSRDKTYYRQIYSILTGKNIFLNV